MLVADPSGHKLNGEAQLLNAPGMADGGFATLSDTNAFSRPRVSDARASGAAAFDNDDIKLTTAFDAPVATNPVTADLKAAAHASGPAQAMVACSSAMHSGDAPALAKYNIAARNQAMADMRARAGEQGIREATAGVPTAETVAKSVTRVVARAVDATVVLSDGNIGHLVREGDGWKCV
jgi:hypothetical protein